MYWATLFIIHYFNRYYFEYISRNNNLSAYEGAVDTYPSQPHQVGVFAQWVTVLYSFESIDI